MKTTLLLVQSAILSTLIAPMVAFASPRWVETPASLQGEYSPGTIVIVYNQRRLFLIQGEGRSLVYPVAVPQGGMSWFGQTAIESKHVNPDWVPPEIVRRAHPELPDLIPGGSPANPMGTRAMMLERGQIAIHGTTRKMRGSIGSAASFGCIRMLNEDVQELFDQVDVGTPVVMLRSL